MAISYTLPHPRVEVYDYQHSINADGAPRKASKPPTSGENNLGRWLMPAKLVIATCGLLVGLFAFYSLTPLSEIWINVPTSMQKIYLIFFGLSITILEGKSMLPEHSKFRNWLYTEFHFLSSPRGKGLYYLFISSLIFSISAHTAVMLSLACFVSIFGVINILVSFLAGRFLRRQGLGPKQFQTSTASPQQSYRPHHHHHQSSKRSRQGVAEVNPATGSGQGIAVRYIGDSGEPRPEDLAHLLPRYHHQQDFSLNAYNMPGTPAFKDSFESLPSFTRNLGDLTLETQDMYSYTDPLRMVP